MKYFIAWAVLLTTPYSLHAQLWQQELKPTLKNATDSTGLALLAAGTLVAGTLKSSDKTHLIDIQEDVYLSSDLHRLGDVFGTGFPGVIIMSGQYYWGHQGPAKNHLRTVLYTAVSTSLLKVTFGRTRPNGGEHSMPSGHTSTAFATATALTYSYGWKMGLITYPIATLVALQRMDVNAHWLSDTIAGATLAVFWARAVHNTNPTSQIIPVALKDSTALIWQKRL